MSICFFFQRRIYGYWK